MPDLNVEYRAPESLEPRARNPRTHSKKQLRQIADSIREFGFTNPVLLDERDGIIAGHGRVEAAKMLEMDEVPTIQISHLNADEIRAYVIADNKIAEQAGWDTEILAKEFKLLEAADLDFSLDITGFDLPEIDFMISDHSDKSGDEPPEDIPPIDSSCPAVSQCGDAWIIGNHHLVCGDATEPASFERLMGGHLARMVFTDPPYNVPIGGHVSGLGLTQHREFAMASGEMSPKEFTDFLRTVFANLSEVATDGSMHFVCMDWRHVREIVGAGWDVYAELKNICVWNKSNGGMGSLYRSKHELVFVFKKGTASHINNVELGRHGRHRTNVWDYAGVNTFSKERTNELAMHPTVKPVAMVADAIMDCSNRGDIVLDAFSGSGTTLIAAEQTGRRAFAMELDPLYVDVAIRRFEKQFGITAVLEGTGQTYDEVWLGREDINE